MFFFPSISDHLIWQLSERKMPMEQFQNILFIFFGFFLNSLAKDIYDFVSSDCAAGSSDQPIFVSKWIH